MTTSPLDDPAGTGTTEASAFSPFLQREATPVSFGVDRIATMADAKTLTLVESGSLDLFAVDLGEILHAEALLPRSTGQSFETSARWTFLCRAEAGTMLVGAPSGAPLSLLGRPLPDAQVSRMPVAALRRIPYEALEAAAGSTRSPYEPNPQEIVTSLEAGLIGLADGIRVQLAPRDFTPVTGGQTVVVGDGTAVRLVQGAGWLWVASGRLRPGGNPDEPVIEAGETVFVTGSDWVVAEGDCVVRGLNTARMLAEGFLWEALERQQTRYLYSVDRLVEERQERASLLLERRRERDALVVGQALSGFTALVETGRAPKAVTEAGAGSPELAVMSLVLDRLGLAAVPPTAAATAGRAVNRIDAIALSSQVRTRGLHLTGQWCATMPAPSSAIAKRVPRRSLPSRRGYQLVDPAAGAPQRVTETIAEELSQRATMVYRPLPPGTRKPLDLLRFGLTDSRRDLALLLGAGLVVALLGLLVPILTGLIYGTLVPRSDRGLITFACSIILVSGLLVAIFAAVQNLAVLRLEGRADSTVQAALWDRLLALPLRFFSDQSTGELTTAALAIDVVRELVGGVATTATLALLTGLLNLVLVFFYSVALAFVALGLVVFALAVWLVVGRRQIRTQREIFALDRKLSSRVFQLLSGLSKLRVAAAENRAFAVWAREFTMSRNLNLQARRLQNMVIAFNAGFVLIATLVIFALVGETLHLSTGAFLSFFAAFSLLLAAFLQFTGIAITVLSIVPLVENLDPILVCEPEVSLSKSSPGELSGDIELVHLDFSYGEDSPLVLNDVSFRIKGGRIPCRCRADRMRQVHPGTAAARVRRADRGFGALRRPGPGAARRACRPAAVRCRAPERGAGGRRHQVQHRRQLALHARRCLGSSAHVGP